MAAHRFWAKTRCLFPGQSRASRRDAAKNKLEQLLLSFGRILWPCRKTQSRRRFLQSAACFETALADWVLVLADFCLGFCFCLAGRLGVRCVFPASFCACLDRSRPCAWPMLCRVGSMGKGRRYDHQTVGRCRPPRPAAPSARLAAGRPLQAPFVKRRFAGAGQAGCDACGLGLRVKNGYAVVETANQISASTK